MLNVILYESIHIMTQFLVNMWQSQIEMLRSLRREFCQKEPLQWPSIHPLWSTLVLKQYYEIYSEVRTQYTFYSTIFLSLHKSIEHQEQTISCEYEHDRSSSYDTIWNYFSFTMFPVKLYTVVFNGRACCVQYSILHKYPA